MSQTVLVADDSQTIRKVVQMALKASKFEVVGVGSAREAVEAAQQKPTVILLDYYMPDGSGYDVCRALKQQDATRSIPVVMLGGTYKEFDATKAHESGAVEVVMKPFTTDDLVGAIESAVAKGASAPAPAPAPAQQQQPAAQPQAQQQPQRQQQPTQQPAAQPQAQQQPAAQPQARPQPTASPAQAPVPESQPRIPVNAGAQSRAGSQPQIPSGGSDPSATRPGSNSGVHQRKPTPIPAATAAPTPESGSGARPMPMARDEMEAMISELVKETVRAELPGLLRNVMGEIFQKKVLPKLVQHSEKQIQQTLAKNLDQQVTLKVRQELERLLED